MKSTSFLLVAVVLAGCVQVFAKITGASTNAPAEFSPQMCESTYASEKKRDPFQYGTKRVGRSVTIGAPTLGKINPSAFRLDAILFEQRSPLVVVNGEQLELNKPVMMVVGGSKARVKALEIGRERVVLEVEGQKVELRLEEPSPPPKLKE